MMAESKLGKFLAQFISFIFHPLLIPTFAAFVFLNSNHFFAVLNQELKLSLLLNFFILSCISPAIFIPVIKFFRFSSVKTNYDKIARLLLLAIVMMLYFVLYYNLQKLFIPRVLINIIPVSILIMMLVGIISVFWKISLYASGIGGLLGYVFFLATILKLSVTLSALLSILIAGCVAYSRLYLGKHKPSQVYLGTLLGFSISYVFMFCISFL
ncbi:phosphatase PAP2 family protein [Bacteroidales bacterium OttesenSCG-928-I21]|nr:phosphatase PAP2 family protein [Bacteroidales bacterium OttesenSCG-928-I21]